MATSSGFTPLTPGLTLGPEHHRFQLGAGGIAHPLGVIWQADDLSTTRPTPVSLLFIAPELLASKGTAERLREQISRCRSLNHPYIAPCYGQFHWRGLTFISWERLDGTTLAELLAGRRNTRLKESQKQGLVSQVGLALEAGLKQLRQPHATLAAEFVYLQPSKGVRLLGFGWRPLLEALFDQLSPAPSHRLWQAPETPSSTVLDARSDVYSLACLVYQLYGGKGLPSANASVSDLKAPAGLSKAQWQVLQAALASDPAQRPASPVLLVRQLYEGERPAAELPNDAIPSSLSSAADSPADKAGQASSAAKTTTADAMTRSAATPVPGTPTPKYVRAATVKRWIHAITARTALIFAVGVAVGFVLALGLLFWLGPQLHPTLLQQPLAQVSGSSRPATPHDSKITEASGQPSPMPPAASVPQAASATTLAAGALHANPSASDNLRLFRDSLSNGGYSPQMVQIPSGRFLMGDLHGQGDDNEKPVHEVIIARHFALSRHEVTFTEYDQFATATGRALPDDNGWGRGNLPVVNVSWQDANAYTRWLAQQSGQPYRLPSEAEWEYAARAGTETLYWWGDELIQGRAVCDECGSAWDGKQPAPVGSFTANPWGLHDMNGNVDEWVQDCYRENYIDAPDDGSAVQDSACQQRVMRGGSWFDIGRLVRSASRYRHPPDSRRNTWGFRVALELSPEPNP